MIDLADSLSAYVATQRGLEDSGVAPENAANRDAQLPATKTTQYEGGIKWDFGQGNHLVVAAFEIEKPYLPLMPIAISSRWAPAGIAGSKRRSPGISASG